MNKPKKKKGEPRPSKYPYLSDAYPYEYELGMKNARDKAMNAFPTLSPEQQDMYGSADVFANYVLQNMDYPVQTVDNNRSEDFNFKNTNFVNLLAGLPGLMLTKASVNPYGGNLADLANNISNTAVGKPYYQTGLYNKINNAPELAFVGGSLGSMVAPVMLANKLNPPRYQIKGRDAIAPGIERMGDNSLQNKGVGSLDHPFIPQADMSEYQYMPNAQEGAQVSDEMGGEEQQQAQMQQVVIKLIQQFKTPEAIQKYLIQQGVDRQALGQVMMMVQQMMQGSGAGQYRDGGMPMEVAVARFKASGRDKGLVGSALDAHVEKMKSQYGYQKGGAVKYIPVQDNEVVELYNNGGGLSYKGMTFPGYNKSIKTPADDKHKFMSIMKKGGKIKLVKYGFRKK
jgi:hypothetical protein